MSFWPSSEYVLERDWLSGTFSARNVFTTPLGKELQERGKRK